MTNDEARMTNEEAGPLPRHSPASTDSFNSPGFAADDEDRGHRASARLALPAPIADR
jgi:hypothetical protein